MIPDPPLTAREIEAWVAGMGRTQDEQLRAIDELLRHKGQDQMSLEDRRICGAVVTRLRRQPREP